MLDNIEVQEEIEVCPTENDESDHEDKDDKRKERTAYMYPDVEVLEPRAVQKIESLFETIKEDCEHGLTEIEKSIEFNKIKVNFQNLQEHISKTSMIAMLWIRYLRYI